MIRAYPEPRVGRYARRTVSDEGSGLEPHALEGVFEPFCTVGRQTEGGRAWPGGCARNRKGHEGMMIVRNQPGQDTRFEVYLPGSTAPTIPGSPVSPELPRGHGEPVLCVDDKPALMVVTQQRLQRLGEEVTAATSGMEPTARCRERPDDSDVVITNLTMPMMDGVRLRGQLREIRPELPVILVSGVSPTLTPEKVQHLGFRGLLHQPATLRVLAETLPQVFSTLSTD